MSKIRGRPRKEEHTKKGKRVISVWLTEKNYMAFRRTAYSLNRTQSQYAMKLISDYIRAGDKSNDSPQV